MDNIQALINKRIDLAMREQGYNLIQVTESGERYYTHRHSGHLVKITAPTLKEVG